MRSAILIALVVSIAMLGATPAHAVLPGRSGDIAATLYYEDRGGVRNTRLAVLGQNANVDEFGGELRNIERCERDSGPVAPVGRCPDKPAYSADGRRIAYGSLDVDRRSRLAVVNADGSDPRLLPPLTSDDNEPAWSPSGLIVFTGVLNGRKNLFIVNPDGTGLRQLTFAGGRAPAWSIRNRIAFVRAGRLHTINPDGTNRVRLRRGDQPDFSPTGKRIVYQRTLLGKTRLYILRSLRRYRRFTRGDGREPSWSPGGGTIVFSRLIEFNTSSLFRVGLDRRGLRRLVRGDTGSTFFSANDAAWQPLP